MSTRDRTRDPLFSAGDETEGPDGPAATRDDGGRAAGDDDDLIRDDADYDDGDDDDYVDGDDDDDAEDDDYDGDDADDDAADDDDADADADAEDDYDDDDDAGVTFAAVAVRQDTAWTVRTLRDRALRGLDDLLADLRSLRSEGVVLGFVCVDDDWCALVRPVPGGVRVLLSDATAALDDDLAADILDELDVDVPSEEEADETDEPWPEGEFDMLEDLGVGEQILSVIFDDEDLYASDQLIRVAEELGLGDELSDLVDGCDPGDA
ncbi:tRNA adenosine deaminase-associated protein [Corynebacterium bovis]|uniref:tRNA adenosine deaminase-associated protein n=1 Tax=Corynebacterium bovis TaxID=36808 RepID=UPI0031389AB0